MITDMLPIILISLSLLFHHSESSPTICFGDPEECLKNNIGVVKKNESVNTISSNSSEYESDYDDYDENDDEVGVRSSYVTGRYCFASYGYSGTCQFSYKCRG